MSKKICFNTNLIYFIVLAVFVVVRICSNCGLFAFMGNYGSIIMGFITQIGIILLLPFLLFKVLNKFKIKQTFKFFGFKKISWKSVLVAFVLGAVVFCLNIYVSTFFNSIIQMLGYKPSTGGANGLPTTWWVLILNLITTAVLPAIAEETLHRGMLLQGNSMLGIKKTILLSGFLFGLLHLNVEQVFYASVIGLFLGYLCLGCNSIYPCIIIHFMNNATSVFLSFASDKGWGIGNIFAKISQFLIESPVSGFLMFMLVLVLLIILAWELTQFLIKDCFKYNFSKKQKEIANMAIRDNFFQQIENIKKDQTIENPLYSSDKKVVYIDFNDFLQYLQKNMDETAKKTEEVNFKNIELKTKILIWGSFALAAIVTIMTFIWGLLR